ncbi:MAG: hypothetical protein GX442_26650 [Candidatus Riflebacteria bacterium]|nr:hypothetical protein [Candidatus Riflebacteria bacterium]
MKHRRTIVVFCLVWALWGIQGCLSTSSPARGGLRGVVTDIAGKPLGGTRVTAGGTSAYTDSSGAFALDDLEPQFYSVIAEREGYEPHSREVEVLSGTIVENLLFALVDKGALYGLGISDVTSSEATVSFYTREACTAWVEYGPNTLYESSSAKTATATTFHQFALTGLTPFTTYHVRGRATDSKSRTLTGKDYTFSTLYTARGNPPTNLAARKEAGIDAVILSWDADTGGDLAGYHLYRAAAAAGPFVPVASAPTLNTSYTDTAVMPGEKVYYRLTRVSGAGEESPPGQVVSFLLPGAARSNLVWTAANNPYELTGDLWVREGYSLTMTPGVVVKVSSADQWDTDAGSDRKVELKISGTLAIQGLAAEPVVITSAAGNPRAGDWVGITFDPIANLGTSQIAGLHLSFAVDGIRGEKGIPAISGSTFSNCSDSGIECTGARQDVTILGSTADGCVAGFLLATNTDVLVRVASCTAVRCFTGIVSRNNGLSEISGNTVQFWDVAGLDLGNPSVQSRAVRNLVAPGPHGIAVILRGKDELRRNTLQAQTGVEIRGTGRGTIRSNLILADRSQGTTGVRYNGDAAYAAASHTIAFNDVWNLTATETRRYVDAAGGALTGIANPVALDPQLQGGSPFTETPNAAFDYRPSGSNLKGAGYNGEDIGAFDVP